METLVTTIVRDEKIESLKKELNQLIIEIVLALLQKKTLEQYF